MEISLRQLSKKQQDSIAQVQMISFNECKISYCKTDAALLFPFQTIVAKHMRTS